MECGSCGTENPGNARFCLECGTALAARCGSCQTELPTRAKFCLECGAAVGAPSAEATAAPEKSRSPADYTPKHLAEKILQSRSALEGERKQVTVLFADVRGSMELADQLGAEAWHGVLERFFEILTEGVHRFDGTVNQYTGDGVMALFGAPIAHEDHAQRACFAALHLQDGLRAYADELRRTRGLSFSTRIGLNSGEVVVGKIGDDLRMDYTAQGHTVGLAQRMEQRAAPDSTCLTQHTAALVEGYFELRELGEFELKGVARAIRGYALEGLGDVRTRLERSRARGFSRFVGRREELDALETSLQAAVDGRGSVVGVVAEAGVGKSRLCLEFTEQCRARGVAVYEAHCPSHGKAISLLPVLELLRESFGLRDGDDPQLAREKIAGRLMLLDREFEALLPLVFDFLGVADPATPLPDQSPEVRQRQLLQMTRRLVQARSAREPAVMLIDDVHWIDPASDTFLAALAETVPDTRTLLLLNFRPEYAADWMSGSFYQQLPLRALGDEAVNELLADLCGSDPSLAPLSPLVRERSGGNPFYVEEIVHNLREAGSLVGERGGMRLTAPLERVLVPATVQAILGARIDRLPEREKQTLQTAAVIGRRFAEPLLRRVCAVAEHELDEVLRALKSAEFIYEEVLYPEAEYAFRHPLTHEVAEQSQLADRRRRVHAAVARELEAMHPDGAGEHAALLAHHWDEAGEAEPAARWHRVTAEWIAGSNPGEASRHWQRVRTLSNSITDEAQAAELGERARIMILEYIWRMGASEAETDALVAEGEADARRRDDPRALAALYNAYSMPAVLAHGNTRRADEVIELGLRHVAETDDRPLAFALELRRYLMAEFRGRVPEMRSTMDRVLEFSSAEMEAARPLVGYDARALVTGYRGVAEVLSGSIAEGLAWYRRGQEVARSSGAVEVSSWLSSLESEARAFLGELSRAAALGQESVGLGEQIESPLSIGIGCAFLAHVLVRLGRQDEAASIAERGVELGLVAGRTFMCEALAALSLAQLGLGRGDEARETARRALEEVERIDLERCQVIALLASARIDLAAGSGGKAREWLDRAADVVARSGARVWLPEIHELRAQIATLDGDDVAAGHQLEQAIALHRAFGAPLQVERLEQQRSSP